MAVHCLEKEPYEEFEYPSPDSSSEPQSPVQILTPGNKTEESFEYFKNFWEWKAICLESIKANDPLLQKNYSLKKCMRLLIILKIAILSMHQIG